MTEIYDILEELAADNSRIAKEQILTREKDNAILKEVFVQTLNPRINFYIKKIPAYQFSTEYAEESLGWALQELNYISDRTYTGNAAIDKLSYILSSLSKNNAKVIERIILRDLRCGVNTSTVNKIWKNLIPETPYMRCSLMKGAKVEKWDWKRGVYSQLKADGSFANIINADDEVIIMTRSGTVYPICPELAEIRRAISANCPKNAVFHGELVIQNMNTGEILPREIGNGKLNSIAKSAGESVLDNKSIVKFLAWDVISLQEWNNGKADIHYSARFNMLDNWMCKSFSLSVIDTQIVHSMEEAMEHYNTLIDLGFEGTIIKNPDGIWEDKTSKDQVKLKVECDIDLKMVGLNPGKGKNEATFGSVACESACGKFRVNVSGFSDEMRLYIFNNWNTLAGNILTVIINNIMKPTDNKDYYSAFLPRAVEIRDDKFDADSLERIFEQFDSVIKGKK